MYVLKIADDRYVTRAKIPESCIAFVKTKKTGTCFVVCTLNYVVAQWTAFKNHTWIQKHFGTFATYNDSNGKY